METRKDAEQWIEKNWELDYPFNRNAPAFDFEAMVEAFKAGAEHERKKHEPKQSMEFTDSAGNELRPGDIVRMYHFTGTRGRKHYMYKRFLNYIEKNSVVVAIYQSLTNECHVFRDVGNQLQNGIVVVERSHPHHLDILKKNPKLRD